MGHEVFIQKINLFKSPSIAYNSAGCWLKRRSIPTFILKTNRLDFVWLLWLTAKRLTGRELIAKAPNHAVPSEANSTSKSYLSPEALAKGEPYRWQKLKNKIKYEKTISDTYSNSCILQL